MSARLRSVLRTACDTLEKVERYDRFAVDVRRQDIDCAYDVPVEHATASRASIDASAGLFSLPTHGACLGRVVLILQRDLDPDMLGLVRDVLARPPMRPPRHFLIGSITQGHAVGYVRTSPMTILPARRATA